jgi:hypothetical protein
MCIETRRSVERLRAELIEALRIDLQTSWFYRHRFNDLDDTVRGLKVTRLPSPRFA